MLRRGLLWLSEQPRIFRFVRRNRLGRRFASRFVAGETAEEAIAVARRLAERGIATTLDLLGESVHRPAVATAAVAAVTDLIERLAAAGLEVNVSVKLTQLGFDLDAALGVDNLRRILDRAVARHGFVRVDMESSDYTERTLQLFHDHLHPSYASHVGVVLQSALRRSTDDLERLLATGARVRLCKGAYREAPDVAFPAKADVDRHYLALAEALLRRGNRPAFATHDEAMLAGVKAAARRTGLTPDRFEFQMLYGVRRDLQERLRAEGYQVRVYVPFGTQWYPYLMRRLAERPANVAFILGNILREAVSRRETPR